MSDPNSAKPVQAQHGLTFPQRISTEVGYWLEKLDGKGFDKEHFSELLAGYKKTLKQTGRYLTLLIVFTALLILQRANIDVQEFTVLTIKVQLLNYTEVLVTASAVMFFFLSLQFIAISEQASILRAVIVFNNSVMRHTNINSVDTSYQHYVFYPYIQNEKSRYLFATQLWLLVPKSTDISAIHFFLFLFNLPILFVFVLYGWIQLDAVCTILYAPNLGDISLLVACFSLVAHVSSTFFILLFFRSRFQYTRREPSIVMNQQPQKQPAESP